MNQTPTTLEEYRSLANFRDEDAFQLALVQMLRRLCPNPPDGPWWTAINPKPGKTKTVAALSKAMGLRAGAPDLILCHQGIFLALELKLPEGRQSGAQKQELPKLEAAGGHVSIVRSMAEAIDFLRRHHIPLRERVDRGEQVA